MRTRARTVALLAALTMSCEDHYTTQEAYEICNELTGRNPATNPPESFADCVACHEQCGGECKQVGKSPEDYACPDETEGGGGGGD